MKCASLLFFGSVVYFNFHKGVSVRFTQQRKRNGFIFFSEIDYRLLLTR